MPPSGKENTPIGDNRTFIKVHPAIDKYTSILFKQEEIKSIHEISLGSDRGTVALEKVSKP